MLQLSLTHSFMKLSLEIKYKKITKYRHYLVAIGKYNYGLFKRCCLNLVFESKVRKLYKKKKLILRLMTFYQRSHLICITLALIGAL